MTTRAHHTSRAHGVHRSHRGQDVTGTDLFCGAGGSSIGLEAAGGRLQMAANHWQRAIDTHQANFPEAHHDIADISQVDPRRYPRTTVLMASPECTHHSQARTKRHQADLFDPNGDPAAERSRATMWDVCRFAEHHRYELVIVENVVEATKWAPFTSWLAAMASLGYEHKVLSLNSMVAHPTPQSRDRIYVVFWRRGNKAPDLDIRPVGFCQKHGEVKGIQRFKRPGQIAGKYRAQYLYHCPRCNDPISLAVYPAASALDFSIPCPRIGDRQRPLVANTMARLRLGLAKFGPGVDQLVPLHHGAGDGRGPSPRSVWDQTWPTQTGRQDQALFTPMIEEARGGGSYARPVTHPISTISAEGNHHFLLTPPGFAPEPAVQGGLPFITSYYGNGTSTTVDQPWPTIRTHDSAGVVVPPDYYTSDDFIMECGYRMAQPAEVGRGMAFPTTYRVSGNAREQVRQYGNGVTPPVMSEVSGRCIASLAAA